LLNYMLKYKIPQIVTLTLNKLKEQLSKPKSTMEQLVDKACGYNEVEEVKKEAITLLEQIVESKKAIGADYSGDSEFLGKLKKRL
ncbi:MAG: hypothetical protein ACLUVZ_08655, partial [Bacteroides stercoris]